MNAKPYLIRIPASGQEVKLTIHRAQHFFGDDAIEPEADFASFVADPYNTLILKRAPEHIIGFTDLIYFERAVFDKYFAGELDFESAFATGSLGHPAARQAAVAFIPTVWLFSKASTVRKAVEVGLLIWGLSKLISIGQHFPSSGIDFYSTGWSAEGSSLLRHLQFEKVQADPLSSKGLASTEQLFRRLRMSKSDWEAIGDPYEKLAERLCRLELDLRNARPH
ncbi:MAG: hypothetical protein ACKVP3_12520 [Hyphomicrobiaceae bacterium]